MTFDPVRALAPIFDAIAITGPRSYRFRGGPELQAPDVSPGAGNHPMPADPLLQALQGLIYGHFYAFRDGEPPQQGTLPGVDQELLQSLVAANSSKECWHRGWSIYGVESDGRVNLRKGEAHRVAMPGEFILQGRPGLGPAVGDSVILRRMPGSEQLQPSYYYCFSEALGCRFDEHHLVRFYFHVQVTQAPALLNALSRELNYMRIPYSMKFPVHRDMYRRTDAAVLYIAGREYQLTRDLVLGIWQNPNMAYSGQVPLFSKALAPGLGLAEDPSNGESFGMQRARLVAEGLVDAFQQQHAQGAISPAAEAQFQRQLSCVRQRFQLNGLDLEQPWLAMGSRAQYQGPQAVEVKL